MNVAEIEKLITALAEGDFDPDGFLLGFVDCFGAPEATVKKLAAGTTNKSDQPGGLWWRGKMHAVVCSPGQLDAAQAVLRVSRCLTKLYDALIQHNPDWEGKARQLM